mmetsp:Transcript_38549/g.63491  ORF Transcript_38549/g.63491 Transcript_38549/m.63491 type:complete len:347 (-) Transcript_38549:206-1246(-)
MLLQQGRVARAEVVAGDDLLRLGRPVEVEVGLGQRRRALLGDDLVDDGHGRLGLDGDAGVDLLELALAELVLDQLDLGLERDEHVTDAALREGGGGAAAAAVQHRHVGEDLAHALAGLGLAAAGGDDAAPGRQVAIAAVAGDLGVGDDDLHAGPGQVAPVLDALGVALAHQEDDGGRVGAGVVRQLFLPVGTEQAAVGQRVDVIGQGQGDDIGLQAVDDRARLLARAAVRGLDAQRLAGLGLPVLREGLVEILVELAGRVVGDVEQRGLGQGGKDGASGCKAERKGGEEAAHGGRAVVGASHSRQARPRWQRTRIHKLMRLGRMANEVQQGPRVIDIRGLPCRATP